MSSAGYNIQLVRPRGNNLYIFPLMSCVAIVFWFGRVMFRNFGFMGDWGRIKHLSVAGEYRMVLEPGCPPANMHLPPHLRLDMKSYLDSPDCLIAEAPMIDLTQSESELLVQLFDTLKEDEKTAYDASLGTVLNASGAMLPQHLVDRVAVRRLALQSSMRKDVAALEKMKDEIGQNRVLPTQYTVISQNK